MIGLSCTLTRLRSSDQGTFGLLVTSGFRCRAAELPWRDNRANVSRIPAGAYRCLPRQSAKYGRHYHLTDVRGRSLILIHSGNYAGDVGKGWLTHTWGCLLLGKHAGTLGGQEAVLCSKSATRSFLEIMAGRPFTLEIKEGPNV